MTFESIVSLLRDSSIFGAALMAAYSIDAWRREYVGKRQIELAEETLALFYEARDAVSYIRSPFSFGHERLEIEKGPTESKEQFQARQNASVAFYRYEQRQELFSRIYSLRYRFLAQFGKKKAEPFEQIRIATNKILGAAQLLGRYWAQDHFRTPDQQTAHFDRIQKQEAIFWEGHTDTDPIKPMVDKAVSDIEETCRGIIEGKSTLYGLINKNL